MTGDSFLPFLLFLFDFSPFSLFFSLQNQQNTQMTDMKGVKAPDAKRQRVLEAQGDTDAKMELARRLMKGKRAPQNQSKAVALLEDCATLGDTDAMLMLAKCCALGHGMEHNAERAESLISDAANKGNHEALCLMELINKWKGTDNVDLSSLSGSHRKMLPRKFIKFLTQGKSRVN